VKYLFLLPCGVRQNKNINLLVLEEEEAAGVEFTPSKREWASVWLDLAIAKNGGTRSLVKGMFRTF
jgi:hypothetical protein